MKKKTFSQILKDKGSPSITYGPFQIYWFATQDIEEPDTFDVNIIRHQFTLQGDLESQTRLYQFVANLLPNGKVSIVKLAACTVFDDILLKHAYRIGSVHMRPWMDEYLFRCVYDFDLFMNAIVNEFSATVRHMKKH